MTDPSSCPVVAPQCPRCGTTLVRAVMPSAMFGVEGEACFECDDASPARPSPWRCPKCGGVFLLAPNGG